MCDASLSNRWEAFLPKTQNAHCQMNSVFKTQQVRRFIHFQRRVAEVVPSHLVTGFIHDSLKAGTGFLQATLQCARAHMKHLRDCMNGRTLPRRWVFERLAYSSMKLSSSTASTARQTAAPGGMEQLSVAGHEGCGRVRSVEDDRVAEAPPVTCNRNAAPAPAGLHAVAHTQPEQGSTAFQFRAERW